MKNFTTEEITTIYTNASNSVDVINEHANFAAYQSANPYDVITTEEEWKQKIKDNVAHLEMIKTYKQTDGTTSVWTSENFTAIDAAIVKGKTFYGG